MPDFPEDYESVSHFGMFPKPPGPPKLFKSQRGCTFVPGLPYLRHQPIAEQVPSPKLDFQA